MELRDLVVTPVVIIIIYAIAYLIRRRVTDEINRVYFIPALTVKIVGALTVGLIYQFYYKGGDTFSYHTHGSRHIWEAFMESPALGLKLIFTDRVDITGIYKYSSRILFFSDPGSYAIVRIAAILDLLTFSTYSSTALLFAAFSFVGMWMLFLTFYKKYPILHRWFAIAIFFVPSVFFWGSGLLKDTITLGCVGMATYAVATIFLEKKPSVATALVLLGSLSGLYFIKIYILLTFLPSAFLWIMLSQMQSIRSVVFRVLSFPILMGLALTASYYSVEKAGEGDSKYSLDNLARTAQVTAYDIRYQTGKDAGSGYTLGELDGTFSSMIVLAPEAINVSLFRPYLWEANNPFMVLSALESFLLLAFFLYVLIGDNLRLGRALVQPDIVFALIFSVTFAFAVGVSTFNFGTLVRYKIPLLPFFIIALRLLHFYSKRDRKFDEFDETEK